MTEQKKRIDLKKILIPIVAVVAVIAVILTIILVSGNKESYRLIKINSFEGGIELQREEKGSVEVFEGLQLISADMVAVGEGSFLELLADSDKHIAAEENTGFKLYSSGDEKSGNISIDLLYGKALFTIENKLSEGSFFRVTSPNATLSVRGTTFSTEYDAAEEKTVAEVIEGTVVVTCEAGEKTLEKGDKVAVIGSGDNVRIEEIEDGEYLFTLAKTYPQAENYNSKTAEYYITVSGYTAREAGISDMSYSSTEAEKNSLSELNLILKGYLDSHSEEISKFFEENKETAAKNGRAADKDITEWLTDKLTIGEAAFNINKAYLNISVKGRNTDSDYYTSETYKVEDNGRDMYRYADGITLTVYGSKEKKPAVTTTTTAATTTTITTTTVTTTPPVAEASEYFGFTVEWNKFKTSESIADYVVYFHNFDNEEKYSGFGSSDPEKYFSGIIKAIEKHSAEMSQYYEKNYQAENKYSADVTNRTDSVKPQTTEAVAEWFDKTIAVTDDKGKTIKLSLQNVTMNLGGAKLSNNTAGNLPDEKYCLRSGDNVFIQNRIVFDFYGEIIEESEPTVTTPVTTEAPVTTTKATTTAPVTTTKKTTATASTPLDYDWFMFFDLGYHVAPTYTPEGEWEIDYCLYDVGKMEEFLDIGHNLSGCLDPSEIGGGYSWLPYNQRFLGTFFDNMANIILSHEEELNEDYYGRLVKEKFKSVDEEGDYSERDRDVTDWFPKSMELKSHENTYMIYFKKVKLDFMIITTTDSSLVDLSSPDLYTTKNRVTGETNYVFVYTYDFEIYADIEKIN